MVFKILRLLIALNIPSMKSSTNDVVLFLNNLRKDLLLKEGPKLDSDTYPTIRLSQLESFFIYDLYKGLIVQQKGLSRLLVSSKKNVDMADIISHFHSEDSKEVQTILADGIRQMTQLIAPKGTNVLKLSFRLINSNGEEIRVLSENIVYSNFFDGKAKTILVKFTKIDFLESSPYVNWWVNDEYMDPSSIQRRLDKGKENIFSDSKVISQNTCTYQPIL